MLKKGIILVSMALCLASFSAWAQMTDDAIVEYAKSAYAEGKSQTDIAKELIARGVSTTQLQKLADKLKAAKQGDQTVNKNASTRLRQPVGQDDKKAKLKKGYMSVQSKNLPQMKGGIQNAQNAFGQQELPEELMLEQTGDMGESVFLYDEEGNQIIVPLEALQAKEEEIPIYGHDLFDGEELTFEPNENQATPENYKLGPGDEVIIDVWGANEANYRETISPDGRIIVSQVGPMYLNGLTISQASAKIKKAMAQIYAGVEGDRPVSDISVTLGQNRTIQINVMGEVNAPGTYRLSSFTTIFNAIYRAGGITDIGSLRTIRIMRGGKAIGEVDIYDYLFYGKENNDVKLQDGDVINVPPYNSLVEVEGNVKRPMKYELKEGESLTSLLTYAGGFAGDAYSEALTVVRQTGKEKQVYSVKESKYSSFTLSDGDKITISPAIDKYSNKVEVTGAVFRPGAYELGGEIATVRQLVQHAGGLTEDAFLNRALILREKEDLSFETVAVDLGGIMTGKAADVLLKKNDILSVSNKHNVEEIGTLTVLGYVMYPGEYDYADGTTIEDLILMAGGLKLGASIANVDVARRTNDKTATIKSETYAETFTFNVKDGFVMGGDEFVLQPYDVVTVRRSPGYREQKIVTVSGEVNFEGEYALVNGSERISDLVKRAGGVTNYAYLKGGRLTRTMNEEELAVRQASIDMMESGTLSDSTKVDKNMLATTYTVGIQLDKALANPGSDYDVTVREGDILFVPEYISTVRVQGEVMYPNTISYISGKPVSYYIQQGGGYGTKAKKNKTYVVYMNGTIALASKGAKVEPGCEIIVPTKPERQKMPATAYVSLGTSVASMAAVITTLIRSL